MRITSKGQVTIPQNVRVSAGFMPGTEVDFQVEGGAVTLVKARGAKRGRGQRIVESIRGSADLKGLTTDEYLKLIRGGSWDDEPPGVLDAAVPD